jgi:hypothetical protein
VSPQTSFKDLASFLNRIECRYRSRVRSNFEQPFQARTKKLLTLADMPLERVPQTGNFATFKKLLSNPKNVKAKTFGCVGIFTYLR